MASSVHKWSYVNGVVVAYSSEGTMSQEDWDQTLELLRSKEPLRGYLGTSTGSVQVSSDQRKAAVDIMTERQKPTAIVTKSRVVIGLATAASWLGASINAFSWEKLDEALDFLNVPPDERLAVIDKLRELEAEAEAEAAQRG